MFESAERLIWDLILVGNAIGVFILNSVVRPFSANSGAPEFN